MGEQLIAFLYLADGSSQVAIRLSHDTSDLLISDHQLLIAAVNLFVTRPRLAARIPGAANAA